MNTQVTIERLAFDRVDLAAYNPRETLQTSDPEYQQIKSSLTQFGLVEPLVWNRRTGRLVGGHQRLRILASDGATEADFSVVDLDEAAEKALNVALNRGGRWNDDRLATLLDEMRGHPVLLPTTGFSLEDVNRMVLARDAAHASDFLDDLATPAAGSAPQTNLESGSERGTTTHHGGSEFFTMSFAFDAEQRDLVVRALNRVKAQQDLRSQIDALVFLAREALAE